MPTPPSTPAERWSALTARTTDLAHLHGAIAVLEWDQQVTMPTGSAGARGAQIGLLARIRHDLHTAPELGALASAVLEDAAQPIEDAPRQVIVEATARNALREHTRATRVPARLVDALAQARSAGFQAWGAAREAEDFSLFAPALEEQVALVKEQAACHEPEDHLYDAALEEFDPGARVAVLAPMFKRLGARLRPVVDAARAAEASGTAPTHLPLHVPEARFEALNRTVLDALGYDFTHGRIDVSTHPFTVGIHPADVRLTTRLRPDGPLHTLGATIHECGHALYEAGLPEHLHGFGLAAAAGAGLHESQSRFWENQIGRSRAFFDWLTPHLSEAVGAPVDPQAAWASANRIEPGHIRVEADEATYNLHVIVRFELEVALFDGSLAVADLPDAWNDACERLLGVRPPTPSQGVLQDIHWSSGFFGYFPSYTMGNLYAAGFGAAVREALPDLDAMVARGEFAPILAWLREHVHQHGIIQTAPEIFEAAAGPRDLVECFMDHIHSRQGALYGIG